MPALADTPVRSTDNFVLGAVVLLDLKDIYGRVFPRILVFLTPGRVETIKREMFSQKSVR